ncbi:Calcium/calmodulin-dependent protein kinase kinase 2 [Temnothorax longispinosus]|uniref:Calcium/calmodulin-dependent protein kinase kinase 2 n=1 Tax=Temnothorax longispinosus TaxID=300112 RepID=A0A4S2KQY8_9HYME|nr:Calcium/calmodulin-dependent protein kinase kinase 2 [Temnothorax longispinosus]
MSSSSGLDMPNVDEAKKVVRNRTLPRQRSFQTQEINDGLTTRLSEIEVTSIFRNPNIYLPRNNDKNVPSDEVDTIQRVVDTIIDHSASGNSNCKNVHKTNQDQASDCSRKLMSPTNPFIFATLNLHASPHRLPRKRIRALNRECFVDNQHDDQQLNQYKVLNEIGKVRF